MLKIMSRTRHAENGCLIWTGATSNGYGIIRIQNRTYRAHRVIYENTVEPIVDGNEVDHLCKNTLCVGRTCLEQVTGYVNNMRSDSAPARNARKVNCNSGHAFDEENTYVGPDGSRGCRACRRVSAASSRGNNLEKTRAYQAKWAREKRAAASNGPTS
jgi:hypothetical protein